MKYPSRMYNRFSEESSGICMADQVTHTLWTKLNQKNFPVVKSLEPHQQVLPLIEELWFLGTFPVLSLFAFKARTVSVILQLKEIHFISAFWNVKWESHHRLAGGLQWDQVTSTKSVPQPLSGKAETWRQVSLAPEPIPFKMPTRLLLINWQLKGYHRFIWWIKTNF